MQNLRRHLHRFFSIGTAWIVAAGLLFLAPVFNPASALADDTGNWYLDDGSGHQLGAVLFERSDINAPSGLRLRLNAETAGLKLDHVRPMVMSDGGQQAWSLDNRSQELLGAANGAIPVGSSQYDAGCLDPIPADGMAMRITVPSSAGDLTFALAPGQVQTIHSLSQACTN
ncbi:MULTISPECIES: DUF3122 domain-containing protein [unclassified Synechococcus]|uniref:DUF3122 domain-containing protein n=1 Tax=unclassified Synechococcus TaxID=2626047 RepID=UPI001C20FDF5|nr:MULTISPECIES: DUF3122 domain-containing protein [unclassified Synechococcus]